MADNLSKKIKNLRKENNLSQEYLAKELGLSRPTYIQFEKGEREITLSEAEKLASIFSLTLEEFLGKKKPLREKIIIERKKKGAEEKQKTRIILPRANIRKFKEVLLYVLDKIGAKPNIGETALYKILYFIDFNFYEKFEEQLTGAKYIKNHYGPTPVKFKDIVKEMEKDKEIESIKSKYFSYNQKKYLPLRKADLSSFTAKEIKHIDEVINNLSDKNAKELTEYSHSDVPWEIHENGEIINYESVFYRDKNHSVRNYEDDL